MNKKEHVHHFVPSSNSGVALIMVLGLLTVMIIMAVTFAVSMRTERLAAGNYADTVRARELVHAGLARAMNDLAVNLGPTGLYQPDGKAYPDWNVTNSYHADPGGSPRWNTNIYLLATNMANEATNYIPRVLWTLATNADLANSAKHWLPIERLIYEGGSLKESNLMGRVAYVILNCSGLLDANYAGGVTRGIGTNPTEIAIANLDEVGDPATPFLTARDGVGGAVRFETLAHLNSAGGLKYPPPTNLFVYSRALPGYWDANAVDVHTQVNLSGTAGDIYDRRIPITDALTNIAFSSSEAYVIWRNLVDYVDPDSEPTNLTTCVESVPMINEVLVTCDVTVEDGTTPGTKKYTLSGTVNIEWWYPFVSNATEGFNLNSSVSFSEPQDIRPNDLPANDDLIGTPSTGTFDTITRPFSTLPIDNKNPPITLSSTFSLEVKRVAGLNETVDRVLNLTVTNYHDGLTSSNTFSAIECLDPRFNRDADDPDQWKQMGSTNNTIGAINTWTESFLLSGNDGDAAMYVANRPLKSVAELGYLVYSKSEPWKTVKLYGPDRQRVLDVFGLSKNTSYVFMTNTVYRGLVNCNPNAALDATAVVFANMPVDQYPGETPPLGRLTMGDARIIVNRIFSGGYQTNVSDIWKISDFSGLSVPLANELQKEAFIRNTAGLLIARQNVFTIIIEAQVAYADGNVPRNPARQKAVAIVWRDPYTGEMFVRHLKWLGD